MSSSITTEAGDAVHTEALGEGVIDAEQFPTLKALLEREGEEPLREELARLLHGRLKRRAPRRKVARFARLRRREEEEVILLKDISQSGVRFVIPAESALDVTSTEVMTIDVRTRDEFRSFLVSVVRIGDRTEKHVEIACQFHAPITPDAIDRIASLASPQR